MKIKVREYGEIEVDQERLLEFSEGLYGFSHLKKFALISSHVPGFFLLQSLQDEQVCFIVVEPGNMVKNYSPEFDAYDLGKLELEPGNLDAAIIVLSIVTLYSKEMTLNLKGPLVINAKKRIGKQCVLVNDQEYSAREVCVAQMESVC